MNVSKCGFTNRNLRRTENIEDLRSAYEELLKEYQNEVRKRVLLEMEINELKEDRIVNT